MQTETKSEIKQFRNCHRLDLNIGTNPKGENAVEQ